MGAIAGGNRRNCRSRGPGTAGHPGGAEVLVTWQRLALVPLDSGIPCAGERRAVTGGRAEAAAKVQQAIPVVRKYWSHGNDWLWFPLTAASHVLVSAGRFAEAERYARESLLVRDEAHREQSDPWLAESLEVLGAALMGEKKHGDAVAALERSEQIYSGLGPAWARTAQRVRTFRENIH